MKFAIYYSKKRRYLTGIDWVLGAMHHIARKSTGIGAISQALLELDGRLDVAALRAALDQISTRLPLIHGRVARDLINFAPFWKSPKRVSADAVPLKIVDLSAADEAEARRLLQVHANTPFASESEHLRFLVIHLGDEKTLLGMMFDHRLFDAYGAELFLRLIDETWQGRLEEIAPRVRTTEPAHLDRWIYRVKSGRELIKVMFPLNEKSINTLEEPPGGVGKGVRFVETQLTKEESARFDVVAGEESIVQILLPSAAARAVLAVRETFPTTPRQGDQFLIFTSANQRSPGQEWEALLFNQFSFLMFTADNEQTTQTPVGLATTLRDQLFDLMRNNVPQKMADASALWRIFPHGVVAKIMHTLGQGRMCSMYFACVRESGYPATTFLGIPARDLRHQPLAFFPPGMNICMTQFGGRYNIVMSYVDGVLTEAQAHSIITAFKRMLTQ